MAILVIIMSKGIKTMCVLCIAIYMLIIQTGRVASAPKPCPVADPDPSFIKNPDNSPNFVDKNSMKQKLSPTTESTTTTTTTTTAATTTPEPSTTTTEIPFYKLRSQVTLYTGSDQTGKKETFRWAGEYFTGKLCYNLPYYLQRKIRSLDTAGTCVEVCEDLDCTSCHRFHPGTPSHNRLKSLRLHDKVRSTKPCDWDGKE